MYSPAYTSELLVISLPVFVSYAFTSTVIVSSFSTYAPTFADVTKFNDVPSTASLL